LEGDGLDPLAMTLSKFRAAVIQATEDGQARNRKTEPPNLDEPHRLHFPEGLADFLGNTIALVRII
jgi:hypothetical protein